MSEYKLIIAILIFFAVLVIIDAISSYSKQVYIPAIVGTKECVQVVNGYNKQDNGLYCRYEAEER